MDGRMFGWIDGLVDGLKGTVGRVIGLLMDV